MTVLIADHTAWQGALTPADYQRAQFDGISFKTSHGLGQRSVHPELAAHVADARARRLLVGSSHFLTGEASGREQALYAYGRLVALGLHLSAVHQVDVENSTTGPNATEAIVREYVTTMQGLLGRRVVLYTGDWWWTATGRRWDISALTPHLWASPNAGYLSSYPGDASPHWLAGYGGWPALSVMQYAVAPLIYPGGGTSGSIEVSKSAVRDPGVWAQLAGGGKDMSTAPVCDLADLEQYTGARLPDPWATGLRDLPDPDDLSTWPQSWPAITVAITEDPGPRGAWVTPAGPDPLSSAERDLRAVATPRGWVVVAALQAMLAELNAVAPNRDKASDGSIGDYQHSTGTSGHNPDDTPGTTAESTDSDSIAEVRARDFDKDLNQPGLTMEMVAQYLVRECRAGRITWIKYLIFNRRIWAASSDWETREYTGVNPHDHHMHVSCKGDTASENNTKPLGLKTLLEDDVALTEAEMTRMAQVLANKLYNDMINTSSGLYGVMVKSEARVAAAVKAAILAATNPLVQKAVEEAARDQSAAAALAAANTELRAIRASLDSAGGDPDLAPVMARLDGLETVIQDAGAAAGQQAAADVLSRLAAAQDAEAAALRQER